MNSQSQEENDSKFYRELAEREAKEDEIVAGCKTPYEAILYWEAQIFGAEDYCDDEIAKLKAEIAKHEAIRDAEVARYKAKLDACKAEAAKLETDEYL